MLDLNALCQIVYDNKVKKHFNVTDVPLEFCYLYGEMGELWDAYKKHLPSLGEEMADVMIYLMGLSRILDIDLEKELLAKIQKKHLREYRIINGVNTRIREGNMPREDQSVES